MILNRLQISEVSFVLFHAPLRMLDLISLSHFKAKLYSSKMGLKWWKHFALKYFKLDLVNELSIVDYQFSKHSWPSVTINYSLIITESIEHDFIKTLMIHKDNQIVA